MKKVYQMPEMMAAEMTECILQGSLDPNGKVTVNRNGTAVSPNSLDVKGDAWDDFDE